MIQSASRTRDRQDPARAVECAYSPLSAPVREAVPGRLRSLLSPSRPRHAGRIWEKISGITAGAGRTPPQQRDGDGQPFRSHPGLRTRIRVQSSRMESRRTAVRAGLQRRALRPRGCGRLRPHGLQPRQYDSLHGYADDVLEILDALEDADVVFVGHSVSAMIGVLAANRDPSRFASLVLVGPRRATSTTAPIAAASSPPTSMRCWMLSMRTISGGPPCAAPMIMGNPDRPELGERLTESFCRIDPDIARHFAHVTFLSDNRSDLAAGLGPHARPAVHATTRSHRSRSGGTCTRPIPNSTFELLETTGHIPILSGPEEIVAAIRAHLS